MPQANDGMMFGGRMGANQRNAAMPDKPAALKPAPDAGPKDITSDPKAMQCVDDLKSMGYTAEDVEKAMGGADEDQGGAGSQMATAAAPLQIPGA